MVPISSGLLQVLQNWLNNDNSRWPTISAKVHSTQGPHVESTSAGSAYLHFIDQWEAVLKLWRSIGQSEHAIYVTCCKINQWTVNRRIAWLKTSAILESWGSAENGCIRILRCAYSCTFERFTLFWCTFTKEQLVVFHITTDSLPCSEQETNTKISQCYSYIALCCIL